MPMARRVLLKLLVAALGATVAVTGSADDAANPFARDIKVLADWFEGEFDNEEQRWFEDDPRSATPDDEKTLRIHTKHVRIDLPAFGEIVFYVEEYKDGDPESVIRQRLVVFEPDIEAGAIRMKQGFFEDPSAVLGGFDDPAKLTNVTPAEVSFLDGCDVFWRRDAGQFRGSMEPRACVFGDGAERRYAVHDLTLSDYYYWRVDSTFLVSDDSLHVGYPVDHPVRMRRARRFSCDVYFYAEDGRTTDVLEDLSLHNQGGLLGVERPADGAGFEVLMREKRYPYYETRPDFIYFSIRHAGDRRSIAFSVNDPASRQLGMRTAEIGAFCHREGYEFLESIEQIER